MPQGKERRAGALYCVKKNREHGGRGGKKFGPILIVYLPYEYSFNLEMAVKNIVRAVVLRGLAPYDGY